MLYRRPRSKVSKRSSAERKMNPIVAAVNMRFNKLDSPGILQHLNLAGGTFCEGLIF